MPNRVVSRRSSGTARRRTTWATHQSTEAFAAANDLHTINLLDQYLTAGGSIAGITIARTVLHLAYTTATGPNSGDRLTIGLIRGQNTDIGTNIVGAPSPSANLFEDWAWLEQYDASTSAGGPLYGKWGSNVISIDAKVGRKLPELQMTWNLALKSSVIATWQVFARTLIYLP
jgi:hypothetical protein